MSDLAEGTSADCWTVSGAVEISACQFRDRGTAERYCSDPTIAALPGFQLLEIKKTDKNTILRWLQQSCDEKLPVVE